MAFPERVLALHRCISRNCGLHDLAGYPTCQQQKSEDTKKHPATPTVLLSCQFLTSPSRFRQQEGSDRYTIGPLAASPSHRAGQLRCRPRDASRCDEPRHPLLPG
jgi:hypothetical protein